MNEKSLGQIAYEAHYSGIPTVPSWSQLVPENRDHWEGVAHEVANSIRYNTTDFLNRKMIQRQGKQPDYIDDKPDNQWVLSWNDAWYALNIACEDVRKHVPGGPCIQCRNPHYDGCCECPEI